MLDKFDIIDNADGTTTSIASPVTGVSIIVQQLLRIIV